MRNLKYFDIPNAGDFASMMLLYLKKKGEDFCYLNGSSFGNIIGIGKIASIEGKEGDAYESLKLFQTSADDLMFGFLSYDLKNETEILRSSNFDGIKLP